MVREPVVSGYFYENDFVMLEKQINSCFTGKFGPGDLPVKRGKKRVLAVIVPHAGYSYSGMCAAWAFKELAESRLPSAYVILAPSHRGTASGISLEDWKTPFGIVRTEKDIAMGIAENTPLKINEAPHRGEHSLEVQLPFLQYVNKDRLPDVRIVPICIGHDLDFREAGMKLAEYLSTAKKDVTYIVSSDFTHYGRNYGYVPFTTDIPERLNKLDGQAIDLIRKMDIEGFSDFLNKTQITICGYMPILMLLAILSSETDVKSELLMHYLSGDIAGDYSSSVSYTSILFK